MIGEMYMQNISERIRQVLLQEYGFEVFDIHKMSTGVGGDTFLINAYQERFIYNSNFPHQKWDSHLEKSIL